MRHAAALLAVLGLTWTAAGLVTNASAQFEWPGLLLGGLSSATYLVLAAAAPGPSSEAARSNQLGQRRQLTLKNAGPSTLAGRTVWPVSVSSTWKAISSLRATSSMACSLSGRRTTPTPRGSPRRALTSSTGDTSRYGGSSSESCLRRGSGSAMRRIRRGYRRSVRPVTHGNVKLDHWRWIPGHKKVRVVPKYALRGSSNITCARLCPP
jgi:hypothetical protein